MLEPANLMGREFLSLPSAEGTGSPARRSQRPSPWTALGQSVSSVRQLPDNFPAVSRQLLDNFLAVSPQLPDNFLAVSRQLLDSFLAVSPQLLGSFLAVSQQLPDGFSARASGTFTCAACQLRQAIAAMGLHLWH